MSARTTKYRPIHVRNAAKLEYCGVHNSGLHTIDVEKDIKPQPLKRRMNVHTDIKLLYKWTSTAVFRRWMIYNDCTLL